MKINTRKKAMAIPLILSFVLLTTTMFVGLKSITQNEYSVDYSSRIKVQNEFLAKGYINIILLKIRKLPVEFRDAYAWYTKQAYGIITKSGKDYPGTIEYLDNKANAKGEGFQEKAYLEKFMEQFGFIPTKTDSDFNYSTQKGDPFTNKFACDIKLTSNPEETRNDVIEIVSKSLLKYTDRSDHNKVKTIESTITKGIKLNWFEN